MSALGLAETEVDEEEKLRRKLDMSVTPLENQLEESDGELAKIRKIVETAVVAASGSTSSPS